MPLNGVDVEMLKAVYRRLKDDPLEPDSPLYVPIYEGGHCEDPVARMKTHIEWNVAESIQLFSGFRGSGKTTELFRLRRQLKNAGAVVLYVDALDYVNPSEPIDIGDILMVLAGAFSDEICRLFGPDSLHETFWTRLRNFLTRTTVNAEGADLKVGDIADIKLEFKNTPSFRARVRKLFDARLSELKKEADAFIEAGVKLIREKMGNNCPIVLLFDQLEQMRGSISNEQDVIRSVERLFAQHLPNLKLPYVHAIYTVPPWLRFVIPGGVRVEVLPCVRLWENNPERSPSDQGLRCLQKLIVQRFERTPFRRIFESDPDQRSALVDRLVNYCGGQFRDLLQLLRELLVRVQTQSGSLPVSADLVDGAIAWLREQFMPIALDDARWLSEIAETRVAAIKTTAHEEVSRFSRFLDTHHVLYFSNGDDWYDVHPIIREEVTKLAKLAAPAA